VGPKTKKALAKAGFKTAGSIAKTDLKSLTAVDGIGKKTAEKIFISAKKILEQMVHEVRDKKGKERKAEKEKEAKKEEKKEVEGKG